MGYSVARRNVTGPRAAGAVAGARSGYLRDLPPAVLAGDGEALACIERHRLQGRGLGWTDVHLITSALLGASRLWTLDAALAREARRCGVEMR